LEKRYAKGRQREYEMKNPKKEKGMWDHVITSTENRLRGQKITEEKLKARILCGKI